MTSVDVWLARLSPKNARVCRDIFNGWLEWLKKNGGEFSQYTPDELIAYQEQATGKGKYKILDYVQAYVNVTGDRASYKHRIYSGIRSFFLHNRAELPPDKSYAIRPSIGKVRGKLEEREVKYILANCNLMYRAIFLSMFQSGMGLGELIDWSNNGYPDLKRQLDEGARVVKVELEGRKKAKNIRPYHTYIGRDGIAALKDYLATRTRVESPAIFQSQRGVALREATARWYWNERILTLGFTGGKKGKGTGIRYGKNPHELRDLFRTRWARSGINPEAAEYFMGHVIDPLGYNKLYEDEEYTRNQYLEVEPWLNLWSEDLDKTIRAEYSHQITQTNETIAELQLRIEELEVEKEETRNFMNGLRLRNFPAETYDNLSEEQGKLEEKRKEIEARKRRLGLLYASTPA